MQSNAVNACINGMWLLNLKDGYGSDPVETYTKYVCILLILLIVQTWFYSYVKRGCILFEKVWDLFGAKSDIEMEPPATFKNEKFEETKSNILGTSQTVSMIIIAVIGVLPVSVVKTQMKKNVEAINFGTLRTLTYVGKMSMPLFYFFFFPLLMLVFNGKVRKSIFREFKASKMCELLWTA